MKADVFWLTACFLLFTVFGKAEATSDDADERHQETLFHQKNSRPDWAVEPAGIAYAQRPNGDEFRRTYLFNLCEAAAYLLAPEQYRRGRRESFSVSEESAKQAIAHAKRYLDVIEKLRNIFSAFSAGFALKTNTDSVSSVTANENRSTAFAEDRKSHRPIVRHRSPIV